MTPDLESLMTYKGIHALCTISKEGKMKAVYYATCLVTGANPLWGVWKLGRNDNEKAKFIRFHNSKQDIADTYPAYTWRRKMARWQLQNDDDSKPNVRRRDLANELGKNLPNEEKSNIVPMREYSNVKDAS